MPDLIFLKKFEMFFLVRGRARYKPSLVCSKFKFKLSAGIQLFGLKTTSHGKPVLKNEFLRSGLPSGVIFMPKS